MFLTRKVNKVKLKFAGIIFQCILSTVQAQHPDHPITVVGSLKDTMWGGKLEANISLDTISNKTHLYGLGPLDHLSGEIMVVDGKSYKSTSDPDTPMLVEESYQLNAPFFVYGNVSQWDVHSLPDSIHDITSLERYLGKVAHVNQPFFFRMIGRVELATIHIVDLPEGTKVTSPNDAHQWQKDFVLQNSSIEIVGLFSTTHQGIITHHDSFLHMHLITKDKSAMGHVDKLLIKKGSIKLYLPSVIK
jgi:acetolactate decarboxylase